MADQLFRAKRLDRDAPVPEVQGLDGYWHSRQASDRGITSRCR